MGSDSFSLGPGPTGETQCDQLGGRPLANFELLRDGVPGASTVIDRLFETSRSRWHEMEGDPTNRVLWKQEAADRFRFIVYVAAQRATSAVDVRRRSPGEMWSHGHQTRGGTVNCAFHHYLVSSTGATGRLQERVEVRSNSRLLSFYRRHSERDAAAAAEARLDTLLREIRQGTF